MQKNGSLVILQKAGLMPAFSFLEIIEMELSQILKILVPVLIPPFFS